MSDQHIQTVLDDLWEAGLREEVSLLEEEDCRTLFTRGLRIWLDSVGLTLLALDNVDTWLEEVDHNRSDPEREQIATWAEAIRAVQP